MLRPLALALIFLANFYASNAQAHTASAFDRYGCHDDRRQGGYHCHVGSYSGLKFRSKREMIEFREQGMTAADIRKARGEDVTDDSDLSNTAEDDSGWRRWVPFARRREEKNVSSGEVIIPKGLEHRLKTVKDLHEKGLITDEEYAAKRQEILGDL